MNKKMDISALISIIQEEISYIEQQSSGNVFLKIEKLNVEGIVVGDRFDVNFKLKGRRYNAFLFSFYVLRDGRGVRIDWDDEEFVTQEPDDLRLKIRDILTNATVRQSVRELKSFYLQSNKIGLVKVELDIVSSVDFEISVDQAQFYVFEQMYNHGDSPFQILVNELPDSIYPGRYLEQIKYSHLEMDGMLAYVDKIARVGSRLVLTVSDVR